MVAYHWICLKHIWTPYPTHKSRIGPGVMMDMYLFQPDLQAQSRAYIHGHHQAWLQVGHDNHSQHMKIDIARLSICELFSVPCIKNNIQLKPLFVL